YPRSFLSLLLIGFTIVAAPLLFALFSNAIDFERLAALAEQAVHSAVRVTQASRSLIGSITALERSGRPYAVAGEATFFQAYSANRATFLNNLRSLDDMALSDEQRIELSAIREQEQSINELISDSRPTPDLSQRLARDFALLSDRSQALVHIGDHVIDESIEH